ncbi:MAG: TetR/AcrR family transcriptional regulator [Burkholderiaceae bacterium]|nr:TetR/AcrR family transcriptional regulator [Burkholderiaceae bacterium]
MRAMSDETGTGFYRNLPRQKRSQERVARIVQATKTLLERDGLQRLTTNHIAREAGVDIASVYQYFSGKEAILYTLAETWIEQVQAVYARHQARILEQRPSFVESLRAILAEVIALPDNDWNWRHLAGPMMIVPALIELEAAHETLTTQFWAALLRFYGASGDTDTLLALARMFYVQIDSALTLAARLPDAQAAHVRRWQRRQTIALLREAFPRRSRKPR